MTRVAEAFSVRLIFSLPFLIFVTRSLRIDGPKWTAWRPSAGGHVRSTCLLVGDSDEEACGQHVQCWTYA
uniref:Uncharacterized protein n=1 Tax=Anguilla anguilla TaxID=7936 RepID=A0A0E9R996_ANGAN